MPLGITTRADLDHAVGGEPEIARCGGNLTPNMRVVLLAELNLLSETGAETFEFEMKNEPEGVQTSEKGEARRRTRRHDHG